MNLSHENRDRIRILSITTALALGAAGCSSSAGETTHANYQCGEVEDWTVQSGNTYDALLRSSGALDEAKLHGDDQPLIEAITHEAVLHDLDLPEDGFTVTTRSNFSADNPVIIAGHDLPLPTYCERLDTPIVTE